MQTSAAVPPADYFESSHFQLRKRIYLNKSAKMFFVSTMQNGLHKSQFEGINWKKQIPIKRERLCCVWKLQMVVVPSVPHLTRMSATEAHLQADPFMVLACERWREHVILRTVNWLTYLQNRNRSMLMRSVLVTRESIATACGKQHELNGTCNKCTRWIACECQAWRM